MDKDLKRCDASKAKACIILSSDKDHQKYQNGSDHRNILIGLAVKKYVYMLNKDTKDHTIWLCMQLINPESKKHYYSSLNVLPSNDQLIIIDEIKMNLLAKSCFAPGLISIMSNLIASTGTVDEEMFEEDWIKDYAQGWEHEIYRVPLNVLFEGKTF